MMRTPNLLAAALILAGLATAQDSQRRVLFLTHSAGFTHGVVKRPSADALSLAEAQLGQGLNGRFVVDATQDCAAINAENLARYSAVVFYTTGELPITDAGREALFAYVRGGGGFVGIHPATDTYYQVPEYVEMIGGSFDGHPWHQRVGIRVEDAGHPSTRHLGERLVITDEIYQFKNFERSGLHILLSLDPSSVQIAKGKREDGDYALAWCRNYGEGRVFYTALGHRPEVWRDARFLRHVLGGVSWSAGLLDWQAAPPQGARVVFDGRSRQGLQHRGGGDLEWTLVDGALEVKPRSGDALSRESFGDFDMHLEFRIPQEPDSARGQARGNSGVYLQDRYEVQILDSYGLVQKMGDCGSIYGVKVASVNACRPPLEWQTYDIHFKAARWDEAGQKSANARVSVYHNGLVIHDDVEIPGPTGGGQPEASAPGPIRLQDHGNLVRYRNLWVLPR